MIYKINNSNLMSLNEHILGIPRAYAREESDKAVSSKDVLSIPHYELHIMRQVGTNLNRRGAFIFWRLPKTGKLVAIKLFPDGCGAEFEKRDHKYILRETDELDRRIVLGFCIKYNGALYDACFSDDKKLNHWLVSDASLYRASEMPKRLKQGRTGDMSWAYKKFEPYDEQSIFKNIQFM